MTEEQELAVAKKLAATEKFDHVERVGDWHGMAVYFVCLKELLGSCYGYPNYILVTGSGKARFAEFPTEVESILRALPE